MTHGNEKYPVPHDFVEEFNSIPNCTIKHFEKKYGVTTLTVKRWARLKNITFIKSNACLEEIYGEAFIKKKILSCRDAIDANNLVSELNTTKVKLIGACKRLGLNSNHLLGKTMKISPPREELQRLISEGKTNQQIAKIYDTNISVLKRWYKENDITRAAYDGTIVKIPEGFIDWYNSFKPTKKDIIEEYRISYPTASRWIKECKLKYRGVTSKILVPPKEELEALNDKKIGTAGIAKHYGIGQVLARQWLYHYDLDIKFDASGKSKMELDIKDFLNENGGNFISRKSILENKYYELDGYDESQKIAFEFCGLFWHSYEQNPVMKRRHREKYLMAKDKGIRLYTIFENEWVNSPELVKSMLLTRMGKFKRIFARNTTVKKISSITAKNFHEHNHINGYVQSSVNIGLYQDNNLMSVMSFSKARFDRNIEWEITRYSTLRGVQVIGGASKMFSFFVKTISPESVLSYADLRWGEGNVYLQMRFERLDDIAPSYFYFKHGKYKLYSRMMFQKSKLKQLLESFDDNLSEAANMSNHNYLRIYDCGHAKYIWKRGA